MEIIVPLEELVKKCMDSFEEEFKKRGKFCASAPGRVNIIGEHTDYNNGFVLPMAIPLYTVIVGSLNDSDEINLLTLAQGVGEPTKIKFKKEGIVPSEPKWANYVKGVIRNFPIPVPGFDGCIISTVPLGGGLSSSASLEVATATLLEAITSTQLDPSKKAELCQKAEHEFASVPCGIMDQTISIFGQLNSVMLLDCYDYSKKFVKLRQEVSFLVVNSNVKHSLSGSEYPERRESCFKAAQLLKIKSLREATMASLRESRDEMGDEIYGRAVHVVSEIERCKKSSEVMESGNYNELGRLMYQSHVSLRDLYRVSCGELDELVDITMKCRGVYGSRMTGGGFGGCIVALVKSEDAQSVIDEINKSYSKKATFYLFTAVNGATQIPII